MSISPFPYPSIEGSISLVPREIGRICFSENAANDEGRDFSNSLRLATVQAAIDGNEGQSAEGTPSTVGIRSRGRYPTGNHRGQAAPKY